MKMAIVTGATRGLGEAIASGLVEKGVGLINISRRDNENLKAMVADAGVAYSFHPCDLSSAADTEKVFREVGASVFSKGADTIYVIQNAGLVTPINPSGQVDAESLEASVHVNLLAPMIVLNEMISASEGKSGQMLIVNVSSGAGSRPVYGWSTYCSTKAGLNMLTESVSLELSTTGRDHKVISFSPGVMDTDMQGQIRSSSQEAFVEVEKFKRYKEEGTLRSAKTVADALVDLITEKEVESGNLYHINDLV
ncbi:benzil reductase ((S)-benzoin forming) [Rossellomorea marisflavi]